MNIDVLDIQPPRVPVPVPSVPNDIATAGIEKSEYLQIQTILITKYTETVVTSPHTAQKPDGRTTGGPRHPSVTDLAALCDPK